MKNKFNILSIETSCDETAATVISCTEKSDGYEIEILSNVVASQIEIHKKWGGVYPEMASRAHLESMIPVLQESLTPFLEIKNQKLPVSADGHRSRLGRAQTEAEVGKIKNKPLIRNSKFLIRDHIDAIAVTNGPGLIGSLLMGVETAQILASYFNKPIVPVNHLEGHIYAAFAASNSKQICDRVQPLPDFMQGLNPYIKIPKSGIFPILALIVSGGHTSLVLMSDHLKYKTIGQTIDDAAGEAFDKVARILDLGYPGGPAIEKLAKSGNPNSYDLPIAMLDRKNLDFSFSGLKTAVLYLVNPPQQIHKSSKNHSQILKNIRIRKADVAASFQRTVAEILTKKTIQAVRKYDPKTVILTGGVSANQYLRDHFAKEISKTTSAQILIPPKNLSTDNALGIALAGAIKYSNNQSAHWSEVEAKANLKI